MSVCCHIVEVSVAADTPAGNAWGLKVAKGINVIGTGLCLCALLVIVFHMYSIHSDFHHLLGQLQPSQVTWQVSKADRASAV